MNNFPKYKSHKTVEAFKISKIEVYPDGSAVLEHAPNALGFAVSKNYLDKHQPEVGGYFVRYEDGYESYSPAKAFEDGYRLIEAASHKAASDSKPFSPPPISDEQLENWFCYHAPTTEQIPVFNRINEIFLEMAKELRDLTPTCADQTAAFRELRTIRMLFNGTVACNQK